MVSFYLSCSQNLVVLKGDVEQYAYGCFVVFFLWKAGPSGVLQRFFITNAWR